MGPSRILIIDDDAGIASLLKNILAGQGMDVHTADNRSDGLRVFYALQPDLVIISLAMPQKDGWETLKRLRQLSDTPIMILLAPGDDQEAIRALDLGANGYLTKPFSPRELVARIRALLRHAAATWEPRKPGVYVCDYLTVDLAEKRVLIGNQQVKLTGTEFKLLAYLVRHAGMTLTTEQILEHVWGVGYQNSAQNVHAYVHRLRQKLERDGSRPQLLLTEFGVGYRLRKGELR